MNNDFAEIIAACSSETRAKIRGDLQGILEDVRGDLAGTTDISESENLTKLATIFEKAITSCDEADAEQADDDEDEEEDESAAA